MFSAGEFGTSDRGLSSSVFLTTPDGRLSRYFISHYNPLGDHFCAFAMKDAVVRMLDPKSLAYTRHGNSDHYLCEGRLPNGPNRIDPNSALMINLCFVFIPTSKSGTLDRHSRVFKDNYRPRRIH